MSNKLILLLIVALPAVVRAASPSLQPEQSIYGARSSGHSTYQATNPAQNFGIRFDSNGVSLHQSQAGVTLRLTGYGYEGNLIAITPSTPQTAANRIEYRHRGFTEWYVNGAQGLEQGFTLTQRPGKAHGGPLALVLSVEGLQPRLTASGDALLSNLPTVTPSCATTACAARMPVTKPSPPTWNCSGANCGCWLMTRTLTIRSWWTRPSPRRTS